MKMSDAYVITSPESLGVVADSMRDYAMKHPLSKENQEKLKNSSIYESDDSNVMIGDMSKDLDFMVPYVKNALFDDVLYQFQCVFYEDFPNFGDCVQVSLIRLDGEDVDEEVNNEFLRQFFKDYNSVMASELTTDDAKVYLNILNKDMKYHDSDGCGCEDYSCGR